MAVRIRLSRHGAKKRPFYRIVVSDQRSPRDGKFIEQVGTYDPNAPSGGIKLDREKIDTWVKRGAKPSQTVSELIGRERKQANSTDRR
jgi:small subunit ribosomal protein S16